MLADPSETIVALATASGPGLRAIVRLSGPGAWTVAASVLRELPPQAEKKRFLFAGNLVMRNTPQPLPADLYFWPGPGSYTGQDLVELHTLSCPPLLEQLVADCLHAGARAALPGEFTMRAFLAGKVDLTRAEAVLAVIEAPSRGDLKQALTQLAGGLAQPLHALREDLLSLLADVEAGLDFTEEDIQFVDEQDMLARLTRALAQLTLVGKQMTQRASAARPFQVVLAGPANAGKSSLFNALAGRPLALVSAQAGTTRDYLRARLRIDGVEIEIVDTAGLYTNPTRQPGPPSLTRRISIEAVSTEYQLDSAAQTLGQEQAREADLLLLCHEPGQAIETGDHATEVLPIRTKCDLARESVDAVETSALTGQGVDRLRQLLVDKARARPETPLAPSLSRCRHHLDDCLAHLRAAHGCVLQGDPAEILALELRNALEELGSMVGAVYTDDLLDRIFSRFCIGK